ncbi:MAG: DnaD domain protein [Lachnospiraceae bacterium]|nr:DnaD domain protein [Lachnospiraceae bacterium]
MEELYESLYGSNVTIISNEFLDKYLADAPAEFIKVFLFYLWKGIKEGYTVTEVSDELVLTEEEVVKALKYWIRKKLIKKECLIYDREEKKVKNEKADNLVDFQTKKNELINKNKKNYEDIESDLLFQAEKLLGQTMSERQQTLIAKCYNEYGFDEGLIQYLLEYCANKDQRNAKYMAAVAESWYEQKIKTADDAKKFTEGFEKSSKQKTKKKVNIIDRNEYNKMFMNSVLKSKINS